EACWEVWAAAGVPKINNGSARAISCLVMGRDGSVGVFGGSLRDTIERECWRQGKICTLFPLERPRLSKVAPSPIEGASAAPRLHARGCRGEGGHVVQTLSGDRGGAQARFTVFYPAPDRIRIRPARPRVPRAADPAFSPAAFERRAPSRKEAGQEKMKLRACLKNPTKIRSLRFGVPPLGGSDALLPKGGTPNAIFRRAL